MSTIEAWIFSYLLNSLWQVPLLFAAGWLAARALRPLGPAAEHRLWVSVLLLQVAPPRCLDTPAEYSGELSASLGAFFAFLTNAPGPTHSRVSVLMGSGLDSARSISYRPCSPLSRSPTPPRPPISPPDFSGDAATSAPSAASPHLSPSPAKPPSIGRNASALRHR